MNNQQDGNLAPDAKPVQQDESKFAHEAMDRLIGSNRLLREARMVSSKHELSAAQITEIREHFKKFTDSNGIRMAQAARACGYSPTTVSEWASGKYVGDSAAVTVAVNNWMERESKRLESRRPKDYVRTTVAEAIRSIAMLADKRTMMAAVVVPSGAGKTKVLKILTEEMRGLYVYCHGGMTVRELYFSIASQLGWRNTIGTSGAFRKYIVAAMSGTNRIIFLDEAHQLRERVGCVRSIHDEAGVPIVMAGTDEILQFVNDRAHGRGQFASRTIRYNALDNVYNSDSPDGSAAAGGRDLFTMAEIAAFFKKKEIRLHREALDLLWRIACVPGFGCIRLAENAVNTVFDIDPDTQIVEREQVIMALDMLLGGEWQRLRSAADRHVARNDEIEPALKAG